MPDEGPLTELVEAAPDGGTTVVRCSNCETAYRAPVSQARSGRLRCGQCGHVWTGTRDANDTDDENLAFDAPKAVQSPDELAMESDGLGHAFATEVDPGAQGMDADPVDVPDDGATPDMHDDAKQEPGDEVVDEPSDELVEPDLSARSSDDEAMSAEEIEALLADDDAEMAGEQPAEPVEASAESEPADPSVEADEARAEPHPSTSAPAEADDPQAAIDAMMADAGEALAGVADEDEPALAEDEPEAEGAEPVGDDAKSTTDASEPEAADTLVAADDGASNDPKDEGEANGSRGDGEPIPPQDDFVPEAPISRDQADALELIDFDRMPLGGPRPSRRLSPAGRLAVRVGAALVLGLGFSTALYGIAARDDLVRAEPRLASVYAAIGAPVNLTPFTLAARDARVAAEVAEPHLTMTVSLRNKSAQLQELPAMEVILHDDDGVEIERHPLRVPVGPIRGMDETAFKVRVALPDSQVSNRIADAVVALAPSSSGQSALARLAPIGADR